MALKHVLDKNLQIFLEQTLFNVLKELDRIGDVSAAADLLYYLLNEGVFLDSNRFWQVFHNEFSQEVEGDMATIAQQLEQKGFKRGLEQGLEQAKIKMARQLLVDKKISNMSQDDLISLIKRSTGLSEKKIHALKKKH